MSLHKVSRRGVLASSLYKISTGGLLARLFKRSLYKRSPQKIPDLKARSLSKTSALFTWPLYKISMRGLLALVKISEQDLPKKSLGKISV